jgi:prophage antirepressor-like protein
MQSIQNFIFDDNAVQVVIRDGKPWFIAAHVCRILDIKNYRDAVESLDDDEKGVALTDTPGGKQDMIVVSEGGLYTLVLRSRKAVTRGTVEHRFRKWVTGVVIPQIREACVPSAPETLPVPASHMGSDAHASPFYEKLQAVRLCLKVYGRARAQVLWQQLGLPAVPPPPPTEMDEAEDCLRHLLDAPVHPDGPSIRSRLVMAMEMDEEARSMLLMVGVRAIPDSEAFMLANNHTAVNRIYSGTRWDHNRYIRVLRRLYGVQAGGARRLPPEGGWHSGSPIRGTLIPAQYLDERYRPVGDSFAQI